MKKSLLIFSFLLTRSVYSQSADTEKADSVRFELKKPCIDCELTIQDPINKNISFCEGIPSCIFILGADPNCYATADGIVSAITEIPGSGKMIILRHDQLLSVYTQLDSVLVEKNQKVIAGQKLGRVGAELEEKLNGSAYTDEHGLHTANLYAGPFILEFQLWNGTQRLDAVKYFSKGSAKENLTVKDNPITQKKKVLKICGTGQQEQYLKDLEKRKDELEAKVMKFKIQKSFIILNKINDLPI